MYHDGQLILYFQPKEQFLQKMNQHLACSQSGLHLTCKNMFGAIVL